MTNALGRAATTGHGYWRAATLGTPAWLALIVAGFFVVAPVVGALFPGDPADVSVEFAAIGAEAVISILVAVALFASGSAARRGLALGTVTAALVGVEFAAIHFAINIDAKYAVAP
ncbi:hypothetical protein P3H15_47305 [Rhodococcus sp. T2V]|uniref:hypothetical protein n=1 Tax=Rhodococcus sp. T2V TaxID=3034164 RepID=UPI0023E3363E|nr:hypothetical protein [Rhodococcus sp. T2V]MDF3312557.1 hypothetical protein [Rhodococcus sp. T2V]